MKYFAYGSNMDPERMRQRGIEFSRREYTILNGWRLVFNKIAFPNSKEGYANIERDEEGVVEGILYEIQESGLTKLDGYEGYPDHYNRIKVRVKLSNAQEVEGITYIAQHNKIGSGLKPSKDYLNHLLKGCDLLSEKYCEMLRKWETLD